MKHVVVLLAKGLAVTVVSFAFGAVWFNLWMYHAWPGPPELLATLLGAEGERAFDAMMIEMTIICLIAVVAVWVVIRTLLRRRQRTGPL